MQLPLDDIVEVMRRCVNGKFSRSAIHRCLKRHGLSQLPGPNTFAPLIGGVLGGIIYRWLSDQPTGVAEGQA
jgi:hypothetical protein